MLFLPLEEALERGDGERLAEPARARDEELLAARQIGEFLQNRRFVNVGETSFAQVLERVDVCRRLLHAAYCTIFPRRAEAVKLAAPGRGRFPQAKMPMVV